MVNAAAGKMILPAISKPGGRKASLIRRTATSAKLSLESLMFPVKTQV